MKNYSAQQESILIAVTASVLMLLAMAGVILLDMEGNIKYLVVLLIAVLGGLLAYVVVKKILSNMVLGQVQQIYGSMEPFVGNNAALSLNTAPGDDLSQVVQHVNDDLSKWAKDKMNEITILKNNEKYRKEFLGNVSHELKTPLFNIQGYISTLVDGGLQDEDINMTYLERAEKNINRLISIVQDLETISKFESGVLKLNIDTFDLNSVVEEIFELYEMKAKKKNITLKFAPKQPFVVQADKTRIFEVISNLVVNSINYGREGGNTTVSIFDIETKYLVEVQDNGIGINEANLTRVFERFFREDKSRSSQNGGTGLGLAIVKHILEAHGERITVKSKIGEGTTFSFTLKKVEK